MAVKIDGPLWERSSVSLSPELEVSAPASLQGLGRIQKHLAEGVTFRYLPSEARRRHPRPVESADFAGRREPCVVQFAYSCQGAKRFRRALRS